jgi:hypothetical protein
MNNAFLHAPALLGGLAFEMIAYSCVRTDDSGILANWNPKFFFLLKVARFCTKIDLPVWHGAAMAKGWTESFQQ